MTIEQFSYVLVKKYFNYTNCKSKIMLSTHER